MRECKLLVVVNTGFVVPLARFQAQRRRKTVFVVVAMMTEKVKSTGRLSKKVLAD